MTAPRHNITKEAYANIEVGWSEDRVRALLGVPPGDYITQPAVRSHIGGKGQRTGHPQDWWSDELGIRIWFDDGGTVVYKEALSVGVLRLSFIDRLRSVAAGGIAAH